MKVALGQIYIEPGKSFPFSYVMQEWIGEQLSAASGGADKFEKTYGKGFQLIVCLSAKSGTPDSQIKGPSVLRRDRDVEYSLFLPFDVIVGSPDSRHAAAELLLDGIRAIFQKAGIEVSGLEEKRKDIVERLCTDPTMLDGPWPPPGGEKVDS